MTRCAHSGCATPDVPAPCAFAACPRKPEHEAMQVAFNMLSYAILTQSGGAARPRIERGTPNAVRFLIRDLERIERDYSPEDWERKIRKVAKLYALKF